MKKISQAFTLVELIIVITILAILATIAFVSFQSYTKDARDGNRITSMKSIESGLQTFQITTGNYPEPDNKIAIYMSGVKISYQGEIGNNVAQLVKINKTPKDPLTQQNYYYTTSNVGKGYKIMGIGESNNLSKIIVKGTGPALLTDIQNNIIKKDVDLFQSDSGTVYKVLVDQNTSITASGIKLGGGLQMMTIKGGDFSAPINCPDGFISVPGNPEFMQPGFCIAKYEMSLEKDLMGTGELSYGNPTYNYNTWKGTSNSWSTGTTWLDGKIVSAPGKYPIANITQVQSIAACNAMGPGYHLVTNNEWMTIARNIESQKDNWSGGIIGNGYISNGLSGTGALGCTGTNTKAVYTDLLYNYVAKTGPGGDVTCDAKRQLRLSNGEIIWDFAGNVWESVNKLDVMSGDAYSLNFNKDLYNCAIVTSPAEISNCDIMSTHGSKYSYTSDNGMGQARVPGTGTGLIMYRGGCIGDQRGTGIYSINLLSLLASRNAYIGFRCAY